MHHGVKFPRSSEGLPLLLIYSFVKFYLQPLEAITIPLWIPACHAEALDSGDAAGVEMEYFLQEASLSSNDSAVY